VSCILFQMKLILIGLAFLGIAVAIAEIWMVQHFGENASYIKIPQF